MEAASGQKKASPSREIQINIFSKPDEEYVKQIAIVYTLTYILSRPKIASTTIRPTRPAIHEMQK